MIDKTKGKTPLKSICHVVDGSVSNLGKKSSFENVSNGIADREEENLIFFFLFSLFSFDAVIIHFACLDGVNANYGNL